MISDALRQQLLHALQNPLQDGYKTHSGYRLTREEARQYNQYTREAAKPGNSAQAVNFYLEQRHRFLVMCSESAT